MWWRFFAPFRMTRRERMDEATGEMPLGSGPAAKGCPAMLGSPGSVSFCGEGGVAGGPSATERGCSVGHLRPENESF